VRRRSVLVIPVSQRENSKGAWDASLSDTVPTGRGAAVMSNAEKYREHAQECFAAAQRIQNAEERAILLNIAQTWMGLAEKEDAATAAQQQQQVQPKDDKKG
jgi:hypothetical protein